MSWLTKLMPARIRTEGGGKRDVAPLDSAKRELLEETGITAVKWTNIQEMYLSNSASDDGDFWWF